MGSVTKINVSAERRAEVRRMLRNGTAAIEAEQKTETEETLADLRLWAMQLQDGPNKLECKVMARKMRERATRLSKATNFQ